MLRLRTLERERLLNYALDIGDATLHRDGHRWKSASAELLLVLFRKLLDISQRSTDNSAVLRSLLPTHLQAMSACFADYLARASDDQRLLFVEELGNIQIAMPLWPTLPWPEMEDLLTETMNAVQSKVCP